MAIVPSGPTILTSVPAFREVNWKARGKLVELVLDVLKKSTKQLPIELYPPKTAAKAPELILGGCVFREAGGTSVGRAAADGHARNRYPRRGHLVHRNEAHV